MLSLKADMRRAVFASAGLICLLIAALAGCGRGRDGQPAGGPWTTGFWFWEWGSVAMGAGLGPVDVIYSQTGSISTGPTRSGAESWSVWAGWPLELPPAREYWLVLRSGAPGIPPPELAPEAARRISDALMEGRRRGAQVAGVQFDIDSPTRSLPQYAEFLKAVRRDLAPGFQISITALLDWFRPGTAIDEVLNQVDEFVPQFYDLGDGRAGPVIAARVEARRWGPVFNRYKRRFRIGVSSFGRSNYTPRGRGLFLAEGLSLLDVATNRSFTVSTSATEAGETVLKYEATGTVRVGYYEFGPGDKIEFVLPTRDGMRNAVEQAKLMGGYCAGVVFFRWPSFNETVTALPEDALAAAGVGVQDTPPSVRAIDGSCAAVYCVDLYLLHARPLTPSAVRYRIRASSELEYVIPRERAPVRMSGAAEIEVTLPAYCGTSRIYLGRAVTKTKAEFSLVIE